MTAPVWPEARCETCRWFRFKGAPNGCHECRRYPPQSLDPMKLAWPSPNTNDWCGEHQPKETHHDRMD